MLNYQRVSCVFHVPAVEDAYLLVLDVIAQLKSEQTMNRVQAAFLYRKEFQWAEPQPLDFAERA